MTKRRKPTPRKTAAEDVAVKRAEVPAPDVVEAVGTPLLRRRRVRKAPAPRDEGVPSALAVVTPAGADIQLPEPPPGGWRDVGERTFGRREDLPPGTRAERSAAGSPAQRARVPNEGTQPWSRICDLLITTRDGELRSGTGWFISPRTVVTAGHCLFVFDPGRPVHGFVRSVVVMPARRGETSASQSLFGWAVAPEPNLRVHPNWRGGGNLDFDYGAIILPEGAGLGARTGFFNYSHFDQLDETAPVLSGYPDNAPEGTQWFERNLIKEVTPRSVSYDIFTFGGMSGSPLFFVFQQNILACAIHNFGATPFNRGVRINPEVVAQLNAWRAF